MTNLNTESMSGAIVRELTCDPSSPRVVRLRDMLSIWKEDAALRHEAHSNKRLLGPITGFEKLDKSIGGSLSPGLHFLTGDAGTGKTALALQIAAECGFPALFITCEMQPLELARRVVARITRTYLSRIKTGELSSEESAALFAKTVDAVPNLVFGDATRGYADPDFIWRSAQLTKDESDHALIVVDSIHSWVDRADTAAPEYERLNFGIATLLRMATGLNCPILCVSERNRANREEGGLSSGAGSRKIEYAAESQIDLNRKPEVAASWQDDVRMTLCLVKNRNGAAGIHVDLLFNGARQEFRVLENQ